MYLKLGEVYRWIYGRKFSFTAMRGAIKHDFRPYIRRHTSQNIYFEHGYPNLMYFCSFVSKSNASPLSHMFVLNYTVAIF